MRTTTTQANELGDAVRNGSPVEVNDALAAGGDARQTDKWGRTLLHWAAARREPDITEMLITAGADVNAADEDGRTALMVAKRAENQAVVTLLLAAGANPGAMGNKFSSRRDNPRAGVNLDDDDEIDGDATRKHRLPPNER